MKRIWVENDMEHIYAEAWSSALLARGCDTVRATVRGILPCGYGDLQLSYF